MFLTPSQGTDLFTVEGKEENTSLHVKVWIGLLGATLKELSKTVVPCCITNALCVQNSPGPVSAPYHGYGGAKGDFAN